VFRDALALMQHWSKIEEKFADMLEAVTGGKYPEYVEACKAAIAKTSAVMKYLWKVAHFWGLLGIASEEGFESAHVILNKIDKTR